MTSNRENSKEEVILKGANSKTKSRANDKPNSRAVQETNKSQQQAYNRENSGTRNRVSKAGKWVEKAEQRNTMPQMFSEGLRINQSVWLGGNLSVHSWPLEQEKPARRFQEAGR